MKTGKLYIHGPFYGSNHLDRAVTMCLVIRGWRYFPPWTLLTHQDREAGTECLIFVSVVYWMK